MLDSKTVRLDGLGTFTMKARTRGRGVDKEEEVNPNQVAALLCHFTPEYTRPAAIGTTPVSYTHLDVYKRQDLSNCYWYLLSIPII